MDLYAMGVTGGDIVGLSMIAFSVVLSCISLVWAIKSKGSSYGAMFLCIIAVPICWVGTAIARLL